MKHFHTLGLGLMVMALVSLVAGGIFLQQGISKYLLIKSLAQTERVTVGLNDQQIASGDIVDSLPEMQAAADIIRSHRQKIATTYSELMAGSGGKYDPTNPKHLSYAQAINLENYLYVGSLSFGVTYMMMGSGAFMVLMAFGLAAVGYAVRQLAGSAAAERAFAGGYQGVQAVAGAK